MNELIPKEELGKPLSTGSGDFKPFPMLPELEPLEAVISAVEYQYKLFKGAKEPVLRKDGSTMTDSSRNTIYKKEFKITFDLKDYQLTNGNPRHVWLNVGASLHEKARLTKLLTKLNIDYLTLKTPIEICMALNGKKIKLQVGNKEVNGKVYQNVIIETIKPLEGKSIETNVDDIQWEE